MNKFIYKKDQNFTNHWEFCNQNKYPFIYAVIGFHPDEIEGYSDQAEKKLEELEKVENKNIK